MFLSLTDFENDHWNRSGRQLTLGNMISLVSLFHNWKNSGLVAEVLTRVSKVSRTSNPPKKKQPFIISETVQEKIISSKSLSCTA